MQYTEKVMNHFMNPRNVGRIRNPDGVGKAGSPICGDTIAVYIKVKNDVIVDIKFETLGCCAAIAASSMATELVKGKTTEEALKITNRAVAQALDGLPPMKMHCSLLAEEGLKAAIDDYRSKRRGVIGVRHPKGGSAIRIPKKLPKERRQLAKGGSP